MTEGNPPGPASGAESDQPSGLSAHALPLVRLWEMLDEGQRKRGLILLSFVAVGGLFESIGLGLLLPFVGFLQDPGLIHRQPIFQAVYQTVRAGSERRFILLCGGAILVFYVTKNALLYLAQKAQFRFIYDLQVELANRLLQVYLYAPYPFHLNSNSATLQNNVLEALNCCNLYLAPLLTLISETTVAAFIVGLMLYMNPVSTLVALAATGGVAAVLLRYYRRSLQASDHDRHVFTEGMIRSIQEALGGVKESKVLGNERFFLDRYRDNLESFSHNEFRLRLLQNVPRYCMESLGITAILLLLLAMFAQGAEQSSVMPALILFSAGAFRLLPSVNRVMGTITFLRYYRSAILVVSDDLRKVGSRPEGVLPAPSAPADSNRIRLREAIRFEDVSYRYPGAAAEAISGLSLIIKVGEFVGLAGASGAGKTTLVDILLGLLAPTQGRVTVDGQDISGRLGEWRRDLGYIPQTVYLTDDTVRRNVAFGEPDGAIDDGRVWAALRAAQLEQLVSGFPEGLEAKVGERGVRISGGERQRIGIARALYRDPEVLVLDEPTSSLDKDTEREITKVIEAQKGRKTIVVVAHRPSTLRMCDVIYRIEKGGRAGETSYGELAANPQETRP